ncbi:MAG: NAD(P)-dependent oxidoreductase [Bacteroidota bacterium]
MKVLVIDRFPDSFLKQLSQLPVTVSYHPETPPPEILPLLVDVHVLMMNSKIQVNASTLKQANSLELILRAGVGMDHFDMEYLERRGITVKNTAGANADAVGEQTIGMLLALYQNLRRADQEVRQFIWQREANRGWEIGWKTVGIIGYGHTGSAVARKLAGFGCQVLAYDKYKSGFGAGYVKESTLEVIFEEADILTLHVPLTPETRNWIDAAFISSFKKPITLLNLARGPIVVLADLLKALDEKKVLAAALDVLPNEKMATLTEEEQKLYTDLFHRDNVLLTPHIGGWTVESRENINGQILQEIRKWIQHSA